MKIRVTGILAAAILIGACTAEKDHSQSHYSGNPHKLFAGHHSFETMGAAFFAMMDADDDGIVTKQERSDVLDKEWMVDFSQIDLNGDGKLTLDEYVEALQAIHAEPRRQEV